MRKELYVIILLCLGGSIMDIKYNIGDISIGKLSYAILKKKESSFITLPRSGGTQ